MATQVTNYQCPACTGPLHYLGESGMLECDYCGSNTLCVVSKRDAGERHGTGEDVRGSAGNRNQSIGESKARKEAPVNS